MSNIFLIDQDGYDNTLTINADTAINGNFSVDGEFITSSTFLENGTSTAELRVYGYLDDDSNYNFFSVKNDNTLSATILGTDALGSGGSAHNLYFTPLNSSFNNWDPTHPFAVMDFGNSIFKIGWDDPGYSTPQSRIVLYSHRLQDQVFGLFLTNGTGITTEHPIQNSPAVIFCQGNGEKFNILSSTDAYGSKLLFSSTVADTNYTPFIIDGYALVSAEHLGGIGSSPTISAGTGAGTSPTVHIYGTDLDGYISLTTGSSPSANATIATITFNMGYQVAPLCVQLTPANNNATSFVVWVPVKGDTNGISTTSWTIQIGSIALTASTTYKWYYTVLA